MKRFVGPAPPCWLAMEGVDTGDAGLLSRVVVGEQPGGLGGLGAVLCNHGADFSGIGAVLSGIGAVLCKHGADIGCVSTGLGVLREVFGVLRTVFGGPGADLGMINADICVLGAMMLGGPGTHEPGELGIELGDQSLSGLGPGLGPFVVVPKVGHWKTQST